MLRFYQGTGSTEIQLIQRSKSPDDWSQIRSSLLRLLTARNDLVAADLLNSLSLEFWEGTNGFGDEFSLLYWCAPLDQYLALAEKKDDAKTKNTFARIASAMGEMGFYVRFIAIALDSKIGPDAVSNPSLDITSDAVERALADAVHLIGTQGAVSGVDRAHTAFHGYLRVVCTSQSIPVPADSTVTNLFKQIREKHPRFAGKGAQSTDIDRVARSVAAILDALNPLRNRASMAHPNEILLEEPEAMLVVNCIRTLLHYLNAKLT